MGSWMVVKFSVRWAGTGFRFHLDGASSVMESVSFPNQPGLKPM